MSAFYDQASLVVVPSGYKTSKVYAQKPLTTDGQLSFTRSTGASRVNSAGLIEKVRTNLVLQSNTFSTTWVNTNSTETGGQAGYDGTNNAWLLTASSAGGFIYQDVTIAGLVTFSIYAKAGSEIGITLYSAHASQGRYFNLSTGALGGTFVGAPLDSKIQSIGSGWYRCSITVSATATNNFRVYVSNGTANVTGNILIQNAQLETGDIATDYIATTSAAVSVGPVANVPRLDYLNSSCPKLNLEPQRTNLFTNSETFDSANWTKSGATITANVAVSPDGYTNADLQTGGEIYQQKTQPNATACTMSVFVKKNTAASVTIRYVDNVSGFVGGGITYTYATNAITILQSANASVSGEAISYGNGWYRLILKYTSTASVTFNYQGIQAGGSFIYGAQFETSAAYATSYIPTLGAAATRGADACSKTGISSLIGQTEGAVYFEGTIEGLGATNRRIVSLSDGTNANTAVVLNALNTLNLEFAFVTSSVTQASITASNAFTLGQTFKFAFAYANNDFVFYVNGVQIGVDGSGTLPASLTNLVFGRGPLDFLFEGKVAQALLFKTRLTNAQLAELTTL